MTETGPLSGFVGQVRDALTHLHDPGHLQRIMLASFAVADETPSSHRSAAAALRQALLDAIESLRPEGDVRRGSPRHRTYQILRLRYLDALDISQIVGRLSLSRSIYYTGQRQAVEAVASVLRERWGLDRPSDEAVPEREILGGDWDTPAPDAGGAGLAVAERRTNLSLPLTSFVGREREMAEVRRLLERTRLLTLTGTGGCGKTRLAAESARVLLDAYPDGVWLAQLAPIADPALVPSTIASALGVREVAAEPIEATLVRYLRPRRCLVLIDNCEHLLDAAARLSDSLLGACPSLSILATSRQPLGIGGEIVLRVPSLASPPTSEGRAREGMLQSLFTHDASRLFLDRARSALPSFEPTVANAPAIGEICRRLDGIPLAIELAAARVRALSPDQIESRLDHDFHLLTSGSRTALPRQQTLRATLDWSHNLLSEQERVLLRRLSVFAGSFALEAAEGICAGEGVEEVDVVNLLAELVDRSLVEADTREGNVRYRLLEPIRQYAWHRLEESGETEEIQRRHATWFAGYVAPQEDEMHGPRDASWFSRVAPENDNVRATLAWCLDCDPRLGMRLVAGMYQFWLLGGVRSERHHWLGELLERDPRPSAARAHVLRNAGYEAFHEVDYERAAALANESLSIMLAHSERNAGLALNLLGLVAADQGDHDRARSLLEQAEAIGRRHGNAKSLAQTLVYAGYAAWLASDNPRARRLADEGLVAFSALDTPWVGQARYVCAYVAISDGDYASARAHLEAGLEAFRGAWNDVDVSSCLTARGYLLLLEGDYESARQDLSRSLRLLPWNYRARASRSMAYLAQLAAKVGDVVRVARIVGAAEAVNPYVRYALPPDQWADLEASLAEARSALGEEAFARAWAEGKAMRQQEAVEYALQG